MAGHVRKRIERVGGRTKKEKDKKKNPHQVKGVGLSL